MNCQGMMGFTVHQFDSLDEISKSLGEFVTSK